MWLWVSVGSRHERGDIMMQLMTDFSIVIGALFSPHREDLCVCVNTHLCIYKQVPVYIYGYTAFIFLPVWQKVDWSSCLLLQWRVCFSFIHLILDKIVKFVSLLQKLNELEVKTKFFIMTLNTKCVWSIALKQLSCRECGRSGVVPLVFSVINKGLYRISIY